MHRNPTVHAAHAAVATDRARSFSSLAPIALESVIETASKRTNTACAMSLELARGWARARVATATETATARADKPADL
jgi:hypothetical protein